MADPISLVGLIVAIPGVIDLCIKYYDLLADRYDGFKDDKQISLHMRSLRDHLTTIKYEMRVLNDIRGSEDDELVLQLFEGTLPDLDGKIDAVKAFLSKFDMWKDSRLKRLAYSFKGKSHAEALVEALRQTHAFFSYKLILMNHAAGKKDGKALYQKPKQNGNDEVKSDALRMISIIQESKMRRQVSDGDLQSPLLSSAPFHKREHLEDSEVWIQLISHTSNSPFRTYYIIDPIERPPIAPGNSTPQEDEARYEVTAKNLANAFYSDSNDRSFLNRTAIAQSRGYIFNDAGNQYELILCTPPIISRPRSLRDLLKRGEPRHSISDRVILARKLALSLYYIHAFDYVHKQIRPENILIIEESEDKTFPRHIGNPLIIHFGGSRNVREISARIGDAKPEREIYRHPSRQGSNLQLPQNFRHDIYSFGVVLLEICLWANFVDHQDRTSKVLFPEGKSPEKIQQNLIKYAETQAARSLGNLFAQVIVKCLQCVETAKDADAIHTNPIAGETTRVQMPEDKTKRAGIMMGVQFLEDVVQSLESIVM